ncbi:hypothetical protein LSM04_001829 [Trypanosoma melophagium]|uniref:uncharacterized protein n=1 Tax=Trypanosoma melophagium TaxID=715481 RepID=UPI00351AA3DE|nr:hypothetical protein LSM04_001829 [Trypanosoma melophagium]
MDTQEAILEDIRRIRAEIDRVSCERDERALSEVRTAVSSLMGNRYGGSSVYYTFSCMVIPLIICIGSVLLYSSAKMLNERLTRKKLWKKVCQTPVVKAELNVRKLSHASRRASRRRTIFVVVLKCIVAVSVLLVFVGSRFLMETTFRSWLKGLLLSPAAFTDPAASTAAEFTPDVWQELYFDLMSLFSLDWFRDIQGLMIFSFIGSGLMVLGLRLLRSASDDVIALNTRSTSSLYLLKKVDDRYAAKGQELMQKQISEMVAMLSDCMQVQENGQNMQKHGAVDQGKEKVQEIEPEKKEKEGKGKKKEEQKEDSQQREEEKNEKKIDDLKRDSTPQKSAVE